MAKKITPRQHREAFLKEIKNPNEENKQQFEQWKKDSGYPETFFTRAIANIKAENQLENQLENSQSDISDLFQPLNCGEIYHAKFTAKDCKIGSESWKKRWEKKQKEANEAFDKIKNHVQNQQIECAAEGCPDTPKHGAHVFTPDQETWDSWNICWIIPTCPKHNRSPKGNPNNYPTFEDGEVDFNAFDDTKGSKRPGDIPLNGDDGTDNRKENDGKYYRNGMKIKPNTWGLKHLIDYDRKRNDQV